MIFLGFTVDESVRLNRDELRSQWNRHEQLPTRPTFDT